jgi:hypothetical protein
MTVSFILSIDEIYTLMSLVPEHTDAGSRLLAEVFAGGKTDGLTELIDKKLAHNINGTLELTPALRMIAFTLARPEELIAKQGFYLVRSAWIKLKLEKYTYKDGHYRITPLKEQKHEDSN